MKYNIEYEVIASDNVPAGMARLTLAVLSPVWRGPSLELEYPDGEVRTVMGRRGAGAGQAAELQVFWTRHEPGGPAVCLIIGGDAGIRGGDDTHLVLLVMPQQGAEGDDWKNGHEDDDQ